jgi:large subunit ribosomal protein L13
MPAFVLELRSMKTTLIRKEDAEREWFVVDATDKVFGRLAAKVARRLMGKHKTTYTPHVDNGDFVIVVNVEKIAISGNKMQDKSYHFYSGYPGGTYRLTFAQRLAAHPERLFEEAVRRMLPKSKLGRHMLRKLKTYKGSEHPHAAQQPKVFEL